MLLAVVYLSLIYFILLYFSPNKTKCFFLMAHIYSCFRAPSKSLKVFVSIFFIEFKISLLQNKVEMHSYLHILLHADLKNVLLNPCFGKCFVSVAKCIN